MAGDKAQSYSGALRTPIKFPRPGDPALENFDETVKREYERKILLLFEHYNIDPGLPSERMWYSLALKLAFTHVPGFDIVSSRRVGRRKKWDLNEAKALVAAIDAQKCSKGISVAIASAMKQTDWKWGPGVRGIETRYYEAKRQIAQHDEVTRVLSEKRELGTFLLKLLLRQRTTKTQPQ